MAFQSLNIIGSFLMGTPAVQKEVAVERERADAYRSLMRKQVELANRSSPDDVANVESVESTDKMVVGDAPEERRNPYLFLRYPKKSRNPSTEDEQEPPPEHIDMIL